MAGKEIRCFNQVRRTNTLFAKTQMRLGYSTRLFGVIRKICLSIQIGIINNNRNSVLISTNSSIRTKAPEFAANNIFWSDIHIRANWQRDMRNVIIYTNGKMVSWFTLVHIFIYSNNLGWEHIFRTQSIASANDKRLISTIFQKRS